MSSILVFLVGELAKTMSNKQIYMRLHNTREWVVVIIQHIGWVYFSGNKKKVLCWLPSLVDYWHFNMVEQLKLSKEHRSVYTNKGRNGEVAKQDNTSWILSLNALCYAAQSLLQGCVYFSTACIYSSGQ